MLSDGEASCCQGRSLRICTPRVMAVALTRRYHIPTIWARLFNLTGPGQDERHVCGRFASQAAAIGEKELPPIIEVGPLDTTRDFIDVRDVASAVKLLVEKG